MSIGTAGPFGILNSEYPSAILVPSFLGLGKRCVM